MSYTNGLDKPSDYFNTKLYTGNGSTQSITGVGFQPDWTWIKDRSATNHNMVTDSVRGATKTLFTNLTNAESTDANTVTAFNSDGFSIGSDTNNNANSNTYASWNWKAGTSFSNSSGSNGANLDSTGSVSTTAGFSIVSFTGNRSTTRNIYHGLGAVPKMIIFKNRDTTNGWTIYNEAIGNANKLTLNSTNASGACTACFASTTPTSTLFTVGDDSDTNGTSNNMIAYCFADVKGYSKAFSFIGNANTNGSFCFLGFKPAFVILKNASATGNWWMFDNKRNPHNVTGSRLQPNSSNAESTYTDTIDFLSQGIKLRGTYGDINGSGNTIVGIAFAESPFVTSTGVPTTAR